LISFLSYPATRSTTTDEQGKFIFKPSVDDFAVLVLEDEGFAQVTVEALRLKPEVKLQPWAKIEGKLMIGQRLGTNESIKLGMAFVPYQDHPRSFNPLSLFLTTQTDQEGRTYDAFKDDPRFRMVGLSLDPNSKTVREYATRNELGWIMGFLGECRNPISPTNTAWKASVPFSSSARTERSLPRASAARTSKLLWNEHWPRLLQPRETRSQVSRKLPLIDQIPYLPVISSYNFRAGSASLAVDN